MKQAFFCIVLLLTPVLLFAQLQPDTFRVHHDATAVYHTHNQSISSVHQEQLKQLIRGSQFLNAEGVPAAVNNRLRKPAPFNIVFYILLGVLGLLALLRFFYAQYFINLFRVFFNTSLRQGQLKDQLHQAQLTSALYNLFFVIVGGLYVYLLLCYFDLVPSGHLALLLPLCVVCLIVIYSAKYLVLKVTGWLTGYTEVAGNYLFIIFLINKVMGILLLPVVILIAFADPVIADIAVTISLFFIGLMLVVRVFRSYGLFDKQLRINYFQFLLYITGIEVVPLLLLYKVLVLLLDKNW